MQRKIRNKKTGEVKVVNEDELHNYNIHYDKSGKLLGEMGSGGEVYKLKRADMSDPNIFNPRQIEFNVDKNTIEGARKFTDSLLANPNYKGDVYDELVHDYFKRTGNDSLDSNNKEIARLFGRYSDRPYFNQDSTQLYNFLQTKEFGGELQQNELDMKKNGGKTFAKGIKKGYLSQNKPSKWEIIDEAQDGKTISDPRYDKYYQQSNESTRVVPNILPPKKDQRANIPQEQSFQMPQNQSGVSKSWEIVTHPMTALTNLSKQGRIPDNFSKGDTNLFDYATDVINPAFYLNAAGKTAKNIVTPQTYTDVPKALGSLATNLVGEQGRNDWNRAGLNTLGRIGDAAVVVGATNMIKNIGSGRGNILFNKKNSFLDDLDNEASMRYREVNSGNIDKLSSDYRKELTDYSNTPIFKKRVESSFKDQIPFEDYKKQYLENIQHKPQMYSPGEFGHSYEDAYGYYKKGNKEVGLDPLTILNSGADEQTLIHEMSHQRVNDEDLLPNWLKKQVPKQFRESSFYEDRGNRDYLGIAPEFDARIQVMRRDLKDLGFSDYTKGNPTEDKVNDFIDYAKKNRRGVSKDALELIGSYSPEFIHKGLKYLPATLPIVAASTLGDNKKFGGKVSKWEIIED